MKVYVLVDGKQDPSDLLNYKLHCLSTDLGVVAKQLTDKTKIYYLELLNEEEIVSCMLSCFHGNTCTIKNYKILQVIGFEAASSDEVASLLGEYADIVNDFGIDAAKTKLFLERHQNNKGFVSLVPTVNAMRKKIDSAK